MSRTQSSPRLPNLTSGVSPHLFVIGLAIAAAGCSADVTRFESPMFGLTESGNRAPVPRVGMRGNTSTALADAGPYGGGGYTPSASYAPVSVAALPDRDDRSTYAPSGAASNGYQPPSYQPSYQAPFQQSQQPSYQPPARSAPSYTPPPASASYRPDPGPQPSRPEPTYRPTQSASPAPAHDDRASDKPQPHRSADGRNTIEVQPGDTLYGVAQRHRVSISELMALNHLSSPSLKPGQTLVLPGAPSATAAAIRGASPPAQRETKVAALPSQQEPRPTPLPQPGSQDERAEPAQVAPIAPNASAPAAQAAADEPEAGSEGTHTLKRGESLYGIAVKYRVPLAELQRINDITDPHKLRPGTVLRLPGSAEAKRAIASAEPVANEPAAKASAPQPVALKQEESGLPSKPVIINAQPKQVAALNPSGETANDASPAPAVASVPPAAPSEAETKASHEMKFRWPVRGKIIAGFGRSPDGSQSDGIKLAVPLGTEVHAAESGVVAYAGDELKGYGNLILLRHDNGWITAYAHNEELAVKRGDRVRRGQVIAKAGKSGSADTPQLHFELRQGSNPVDPLPHLEKL